MTTLATESTVLTDVRQQTWMDLIPHSPQSGPGAILKRLIDILGASVGLALMAFPLLVMAFLIYRESGWPVIFAQERVGLGGRRFTVYKLRSMTLDAEQRHAELKQLNEISDGPIFKMRDDPRVTRVGRVLRRLSLDELPQLWNVLTGSMSLVGPRPPLESEVLDYEPWQLQRLSAKPGMTGLWQVSGRSTLGFREMVELDLDYVRRWSVLFDLWLLLRTLPVVLSRKGAY